MHTTKTEIDKTLCIKAFKKLNIHKRQTNQGDASTFFPVVNCYMLYIDLWGLYYKYLIFLANKFSLKRVKKYLKVKIEFVGRCTHQPLRQTF